MKYYVFLVLTVLFWSGNFVFGRLVSTSIEPMQLSFFRWFFVLVILMPYILIHYKNIFSVFKKKYILIITFGALGISGFNTFLYYGLQTTTATNALLINSSIPIFIIVLSTLIFRTKITKIQLTGVITSTLGVMYLILKGEISHISELKFTSGDLWIIAACVDWALYTVLLKHKPKELNSFEFFGLTTFIGTIILYVLFLYQGYSFNLDFLENDKVLYSLIYIVIFPSILAFYFWNISTVEVGVNKAGQFTHLMPIFGAILAYLFLGEVLKSYHLVGISLIGLGIYLSIFFKREEI
jgi:drug/metabolite transporter (DMT)-like permease